MVGRERAAAMIEDQLEVDHRPHLILGEQFDPGDFVRGTKAIEEVQERDARLECGGVRDQGEVLRLLHARGAEHHPTGRAYGHHVGVVSEDREGVRGQRTRGDMKHRRCELAGDLVHVRNHQQQALRRGEGRGQRSCLQCAVYCSGGAALALHLHDLGDRAPQVLPLRRRPGICPFTHRRRWCDRVDGDHLVHGVGDPRHGFVAVDHRVLCDVFRRRCLMWSEDLGERHGGASPSDCKVLRRRTPRDDARQAGR